MIRPLDFKVTIHDDVRLSYEDYYERSVEEDFVSADPLGVRTVNRLSRWVETHPDCEREDLELLGRHLFRLLFHGKVGTEFKTSYRLFRKEAAHDTSLRLRLWLVFHREADVLASLPWEFLFMPEPDDEETGLFLAGEETKLILARFVPRTKVAESLRPDERPLRILVAHASPEDPRYDLARLEVGDVVERIRHLHDDENIVVDVVPDPDFVVLEERIKEFKPHILHFIGHGREGQIALFRKEDQIERDLIKSPGGARHEAEWLDSRTVSKLFARHKPRLVFLHACKGAATFLTSLKSFTSTARELVYADVPAVIGMQFEIENRDAATFAQVFYRKLETGVPVDEAVREGRYALGMLTRRGSAWADRRFATPLVYLQTSDPIIYLPPSQPDGQDEAGPRTRCPSCRKTIPGEYPHCPFCGEALQQVAAATAAPAQSAAAAPAAPVHLRGEDVGVG